MAGTKQTPNDQAIPLDEAAFKDALMAGLRFWSMSTGTPLPGNAQEIVEHQASAVRRRRRQVSPSPAVDAPSDRLSNAQSAVQEESPALPWWQRY